MTLTYTQMYIKCKFETGKAILHLGCMIMIMVMVMMMMIYVVI